MKREKPKKSRKAFRKSFKNTVAAPSMIYLKNLIPLIRA